MSVVPFSFDHTNPPTTLPRCLQPTTTPRLLTPIALLQPSKEAPRFVIPLSADHRNARWSSWRGSAPSRELSPTTKPVTLISRATDLDPPRVPRSTIPFDSCQTNA